MRTSTEHSETWQVRIAREEGDDWPDMPALEGGTFRPETIVIQLRRGREHPGYHAHGFLLRKDGTPGHRRGHNRGTRVPWLQEFCETWRRQNGLGPGATGVDW